MRVEKTKHWKTAQTLTSRLMGLGNGYFYIVTILILCKTYHYYQVSKTSNKIFAT